MQNDNEKVSPINYPQTPNASGNPQVRENPVQPQNQLQTQSEQQPTNLPVSQTFPPPQKRSPDKFLLLGLIILGIAVGLAALSFILQNGKKNSGDRQVVTQKTNPFPIDKMPTQVPDPTANWDAFVASDYLVKYPPDTLFGDSENGTLTLSVQGPTQTEGTELFDGFAITFQPKTSLETPDKYAERLIAEIEIAGVGEITKDPGHYTLNGYEGVSFIEEGLGTYQHILLSSENNKRLILISVLVADPGNQGFQNTVDQILSTFEFIPGM